MYIVSIYSIWHPCSNFCTKGVW